MEIFELAHELALVRSAAETLGWDQETCMPEAAAEHRARQIAWLSGRAHELAISPRWQDALESALSDAADEDRKTAGNLHRMRRDFERASKLPVELVEREAAATSLAKHAWAEARAASDFAKFSPHLETIVALSREKAACWGFTEEPYDALLESYERGTSTREIATLFGTMLPKLREISATAVAESAAHPAGFPTGDFPQETQRALNAEIAAAIGFDFSMGRIDATAHPFCTTLGPRDVRLTTRYDEADFTSSLFGVLHETGHGLYELGLPAEDFGLPSGSSLSLGIHESQSRLWENHVGRSEAFWEKWYPAARAAFPALGGFPLGKFLSHIRRSAFSPIRVDADEATYDLHIILRFELERKLIDGSLAVSDVPAAWNEAFRASFGLTPPDDAHGCLQDIHWSMGGIGYFATYTLGNINAAQIFAAANRAPAVSAGISAGDYLPLLGWLRENIHAHGALPEPRELITRATGSPPAPDAYLAHLRSRYTR